MHNPGELTYNPVFQALRYVGPASQRCDYFRRRLATIQAMTNLGSYEVCFASTGRICRRP